MGNGKVWKKLWWIWQKLDDRYGTTWYPRWRWVQHTRWQDKPDRQLTVDETVEDMSIACGEDLAPFFKKIGTTLKRDRIESATFQGKAIALPVAPIEVSPAGNARHDPIGDFTKPIKPGSGLEVFDRARSPHGQGAGDLRGDSTSTKP